MALTIVPAQWEHRWIAKCGVRSATMRPRSRHCTNTRRAGAPTYRSRELARWEHRKSSRDMARRLSVKPIKTAAMAPQTVIPEHPPMSIRMAKLVKELASWNCLLDRWWSHNFTEAMDWMILSKMGLAGVVLLTIALRIGPLAG